METSVTPLSKHKSWRKQNWTCGTQLFFAESIMFFQCSMDIDFEFHSRSIVQTQEKKEATSESLNISPVKKKRVGSPKWQNTCTSWLKVWTLQSLYMLCTFGLSLVWAKPLIEGTLQHKTILVRCQLCGNSLRKATARFNIMVALCTEWVWCERTWMALAKHWSRPHKTSPDKIGTQTAGIIACSFCLTPATIFGTRSLSRSWGTNAALWPSHPDLQGTP